MHNKWHCVVCHTERAAVYDVMRKEVMKHITVWYERQHVNILSLFRHSAAPGDGGLAWGLLWGWLQVISILLGCVESCKYNVSPFFYQNLYNAGGESDTIPTQRHRNRSTALTTQTQFTWKLLTTVPHSKATAVFSTTKQTFTYLFEECFVQTKLCSSLIGWMCLCVIYACRCEVVV